MIIKHYARSGSDWFARHGPLEESRHRRGGEAELTAPEGESRHAERPKAERVRNGDSGEYKNLFRPRPL